MESFRQSGEKISELSWYRRAKNDGEEAGMPIIDFREVGLMGVSLDVRMKAMIKEIDPLQSSLSKTAAAGEYAFESGVETLE